MGKSLLKKAENGRVKAEEIDAVIEGYIDSSSLLCTDTATNYKKFAKIKALKHEPINLSKEGYVKNGIYHLQNVNNYHKRLKTGWIGSKEWLHSIYIITLPILLQQSKKWQKKNRII